jgi:hypothetical protein
MVNYILKTIENEFLVIFYIEHIYSIHDAIKVEKEVRRNALISF